MKAVLPGTLLEQELVHSGGTCAGRAGMFAACGMAVNVLHTRAPNLQTNARNLSSQSLSTGYH